MARSLALGATRERLRWRGRRGGEVSRGSPVVGIRGRRRFIQSEAEKFEAARARIAGGATGSRGPSTRHRCGMNPTMDRAPESGRYRTLESAERAPMRPNQSPSQLLCYSPSDNTLAADVLAETGAGDRGGAGRRGGHGARHGGHPASIENGCDGVKGARDGVSQPGIYEDSAARSRSEKALLQGLQSDSGSACWHVIG